MDFPLPPAFLEPKILKEINLEDTSKLINRKVIASVQKALDILALFDKTHEELGNAEIARMVNLPVGTASGLIYTLKVNHYLDQNPVNRKYRLGLKLAERTAVLMDQLDLRKVSASFLEELRDWCGESVNLGVRDGNEIVYIERMFGNHSLGIRSELGRRGPLHSTSLGKAILAFVSESEKLAFFEQNNFVQMTPLTIIDPQKFKQELELTRQRGYAIDEQENEMGGRCVGAPIFDRHGYPIASISISVPIQRFPEEDVKKFGLKLIETAEKISNRMGNKSE